ncbi:Uncharacterised protein [Porphyromonas macacae]|uniref:Uncharacterized protein n=1 Tax=Porphyromonas macacae TaxID=28115 RepID=A0A379DI62_9PORP|nr:Uncharacterised protein [Porphyromonas macacae]
MTAVLRAVFFLDIDGLFSSCFFFENFLSRGGAEILCLMDKILQTKNFCYQ